MAALKASSSGLRAPQAAGSRRGAPRAVSSAARSSAARHQPSWQLRAAEVDDVEVTAAQVGVADAEALVRQVMREASIEKAFLDGVGDAETAKYLDVLEAAAVELDEADGSVLEAVISDVAQEVAGDAVAAEVLEEAGPTAYLTEEDQDPDVLTGMDNAAAVEALRVVDALKLSKAELESDVVPSKDWDSETLDWFAAPKKGEELPLPEYRLNVLWHENNIAVAVDQVYARGGVSPLTEYFFWPRKDAWEELRVSLEARPWISEAERVMLLNRLTEVINFWQDLPEGEPRPTLEEARATFPDCTFTGATA